MHSKQWKQNQTLQGVKPMRKWTYWNWMYLWDKTASQSNNVKWDIFIFNVFIKVLLSVYKGEIMQHCSGHNNDEGIR